MPGSGLGRHGASLDLAVPPGMCLISPVRHALHKISIPSCQAGPHSPCLPPSLPFLSLPPATQTPPDPLIDSSTPRVGTGPFNLSVSSRRSFPELGWLRLWLSTVWPAQNNLASYGPPPNLQLSKQACGLCPSIYPAPSTDLTLAATQNGCHVPD